VTELGSSWGIEAKFGAKGNLLFYNEARHDARPGRCDPVSS